MRTCVKLIFIIFVLALLVSCAQRHTVELIGFKEMSEDYKDVLSLEKSKITYSTPTGIDFELYLNDDDTNMEKIEEMRQKALEYAQSNEFNDFINNEPALHVTDNFRIAIRFIKSNGDSEGFVTCKKWDFNDWDTIPPSRFESNATEPIEVVPQS